MIPQGQPRAESGHERKDADVLSVALVAALVLLLLTISFLLARGVFRFADRAEKPPRLSAVRAHFPSPRLQAHPAADLAFSKRAREKELHSYGWVDRKAGVARIPIERAMELLLERGLPEVGAGQTRLQLMQNRATAESPSP
ncbi:MAG: hypothetical protein ABI839_04735 [Verrucomicrobiota bacterium]